MEKISVIGMGSWGTTLAILLAEKGYNVLGWEWIKERATLMQDQHENKYFLPGISFPPNLTITNDLDEATVKADFIILAVPSHIVRKIMEGIRKVAPTKNIVNVAKGIENETMLRMSEIIHQVGNVPREQIVTLSGPTHSEEVSKKLPATIVAASVSEVIAQKVQQLFMTNYFRVYRSTDIIGVELGGSLKNVIAIGAGISDGMGLGDNTKAALITRGLREITRLGVACGANPHTFSGVSGIGDLIVTCGSRHSRNRFVGEQLAKGKSLQEITSHMEMIAEGIKTTKSAYQLSRKMNIDMPITDHIYQVLFEDLSPQEGVTQLMTRSPRSEDEF
ncbi:MAG TPA: NAD(P)H-dependent glycerol-3-phosphate dehydrogenase [Candidatus Cloacimonetes bacterium]|nr:NAD(P)H-dependent glycerol-3-phosphate dehydrogenase [Candidatus Cloacimonadota bacterium]HEX38034.1 NAD(P)H-dependent glycerol-3-phosphate dehydrogenase [Candidatus Cloacimonadota bacterium]